MLAWHGLTEDRRMGYGRRQHVEAGKTYRVRGEIALCERGLHASARAIDWLSNTPGPVVCRVRLGGRIISGGDKAVASERTVLWMADATRTLHEFACYAAEWILDRLEAGGEEIDPRSRRAIGVKRLWLDGKATDEVLAAAGAAAWDAAGDAAVAAAWAAARAAAWAAAGAAAVAAAGAAAWAAARAAAVAAAWDAARAAAVAAARAAAGDAARAAARAAAWDAAWDAAGDHLNDELTRRLMALAPEGYAEEGS